MKLNSRYAQTLPSLRTFLSLAGIIATAWGMTTDVKGDTVIWQGSGNGAGGQQNRWFPNSGTNWFNQTNAGNNLFETGDTAIFGSDSVRSINVNSAVLAGSLEFQNTSGNPYTFSGGLIEVGNNRTDVSGAPAGSIQVNDTGSILLSGTGTNRIADTTAIYLNGGQLEISGGNETLGALTLTTPAAGISSLNFSSATGSNLLFSSLSGTGQTLNVFNFTLGSDHLYVNNAPSGVTINFYSGNDTSSPVTYNAEVVPEPSTILAGLGLVGFLGWRERRRISSLFKREEGEEALATA